MSAVPPPLRCGLIEDHAALDRLRTPWQALCDRDPGATPFQRPDWLLAWARQHRDAQPFSIAVWEAERLLGLAPLFRYPRCDLDGSTQVLAFLGAGVSDYLDLLIAPEREPAVLAAMLATLAANRSRWDVCELDQVRPTSSPLTRLPLLPGWTRETSPQTVSPCLSLPDQLDQLHHCVPARHWRRFQQTRRRVAKMGTVRLQRATPQTCERLLTTLFQLHALRWRDRGEPGVLTGSNQHQFHREAAAGFAARGALALYGLHLGDRTIACFYGFEAQKTLYFYLSGFDPNFAQLSPGVVLLGLVIEDAVSRGLARFDFLRGAEAYKYWWGARDQLTVRVRLHSRT